MSLVDPYDAREATIELLRICNKAGNLTELMRDLMLFFQRLTGCEAVGVRLRQGDDFPYYETRGFPVEFVLAENSLCAIDSKGELVRDGSGHPALDCMCGNILCGRFDPSRNFFTGNGSFWSSCTTELLATTSDTDRQAKTRNRCNGEGYESVALVPLRTQSETFGLFQFNDRERGRFTAEKIALLEELVGYVAIGVAKRKTDEVLRSSEEGYRSLFENMAEGYAYCRMLYDCGRPDDFVYLNVNESFGTLTGLKDVLGKKVSEIIPGIRDTDPGLFEIYGRVASTGRPERFEMHVAALGQWFSVSVYSPKMEHFVAVFDVTTDHKHAEAEKEKLQAQLQQAMKMEAVGRLAGGIAHDFNNLLTVITGYSEFLLQKIGKGSPLRGEVEEIMRAGERAASLTQQLLAFSRKQIIEPKVVRLHSLVADMQEMLTRLIGENISLQVATCDLLGSVKVDPGQFQQILMNLVVNARDAMPDGGRISIETANADLDEGYCARHPDVTPGRFVRMSVSDTGRGMSDEVKTHIFEPFFTTKEQGSGTGLGLATTYGAVHQAGGSIEVYSETGRGTTIKIYLPRVDAEAVDPVSDEGETDDPGGTETVLLVEDEDILRKLGARILGQLGYRVLQARNGSEAIKEVQGHDGRIDLLLTDVVMPGMNGSDLATQLILHQPEMKVLFTSGYTEDTITHHGVLSEGVNFIGKPYTPSALARKVREVLKKA